MPDMNRREEVVMATDGSGTSRMRRVTIVVLAIGILAGASWWLDFRVAASESRSESQVATYRSGAEQRVEGMQPKHDLALYVAAEEDLAAVLREELESRLEKTPVFEEVGLLRSQPEKADRPVLVVEVGGGDSLWTPLFARSVLPVKVTYASDGETGWTGQRPVVMPSGRSTVRVEGKLQLQEETRGVTSYRAYRRMLGQQIAVEVNRALLHALKDGAA